MTTKLILYNLALGHLRERALASTSENREPRRVLDSYYDQVVAECLAEGFWNFMVRAVSITRSTAVTPAFGFRYAFKHPTDWVRTVATASNQDFNPPLFDLLDEAGYWYANSTPLYVRYISNDVAYGMDLTKWTPLFIAFVGLKLAEYSCHRITGSDSLLQGPQGIVKRASRAGRKAKSVDSLDEPLGRPPRGTWAASRNRGVAGLPAPGGDMFDD